MPVPRSTFKGKVVVRREMTTHHAQQHNRQHQTPKEHMKTVEAGEHEKGGTKDPGAEFEVEVTVSVDVFVGLAAEKDGAKHNRQKQPENRLAALGGPQSMV